jgi:hypothetical protein
MEAIRKLLVEKAALENRLREIDEEINEGYELLQSVVKKNESFSRRSAAAAADATMAAMGFDNSDDEAKEEIMLVKKKPRLSKQTNGTKEADDDSCSKIKDEPGASRETKDECVETKDGDPNTKYVGPFVEATEEEIRNNRFLAHVSSTFVQVLEGSKVAKKKGPKTIGLRDRIPYLTPEAAWKEMRPKLAADLNTLTIGVGFTSDINQYKTMFIRHENPSGELCWCKGHWCNRNRTINFIYQLLDLLETIYADAPALSKSTKGTKNLELETNEEDEQGIVAYENPNYTKDKSD